MKKPTKKTKEEQERYNVAAMVAHGWSDDYLRTRKPADLVNSYGCSEHDAGLILKAEHSKRRLTKA